MKKLLILIHGSKEHKDRYKNTINELNNNSIDVYTGDLATHGSLLKESKHNFTFNEMLESALKIIDDAFIKYPKHEKIIFGHSMGSFIVKYITYNNLREFDKVILSGTNNTPTSLTNIGLFFTGIVRRNKVNKFNEFFSYGILNLRMKLKGLGNNWLSNYEEEVEKFIDDPLCANPFTNQSLNAMFKFIKYSGKKSILKNFKNKDIKQLILYGENDPVTNFGKDIKSLVKKQSKCGIKNHIVISYPNCKHEILFDIEKNKVDKDIVNFIK